MPETPPFSFDQESQPSSHALHEAYGKLMTPGKSYLLLSDLEKFGTDTTEWIGEKNKQHIIVFKSGSLVEQYHDQLQNSGVHVYPKRIIEQNVVLEIPKGSKTLRAVTGLIGRDPSNYRVVYRLLGEELSHIKQAGLGVPSGNWLDQFAYSLDMNATYGANLYFLPPYNLTDREVDVTKEIVAQLGDTTSLTEDIINQLMWEAYDGWNRD